MENNFFQIKSNSSKNTAVALFIVNIILSIFLFYAHHMYLGIFSSIVSLYFLFLFHKEVYINSEKIILYYPFRPFWKRRVVPVNKLKTFKFKPSQDGPNGWPYIRLKFSDYPFFTEFRITGMNEVYESIRLLALNGHFRVKASDIRKKELKKFLDSQNITNNLKWG